MGSMLNRLLSIEYQFMKTFNENESTDSERVSFAQTILRSVVGTANLKGEPVATTTMPTSFLGTTVSWGTNNSTFTVTFGTYEALNQGINAALVAPTLTVALTTITDMIISLGAPVDGDAPTISIDQSQYTGTIVWSPAHNPFEFDVVYTATITLTPKEGYTLTGVGEDTFIVHSADTVTHDADSGVITAVFPPAGDGGIALPG